jgi:hypothetical protein
MLPPRGNRQKWSKKPILPCFGTQKHQNKYIPKGFKCTFRKILGHFGIALFYRNFRQNRGTPKGYFRASA